MSGKERISRVEIVEFTQSIGSMKFHLRVNSRGGMEQLTFTPANGPGFQLNRPQTQSLLSFLEQAVVVPPDEAL